MVAAFLFGAGMPDEAVLCLGADGHVDMKTAHHPKCSHSAPASAGHFHTHTDSSETCPGNQTHTAPKHCKPCLDIPFSLGGNEVIPQSYRNNIILKTLMVTPRPTVTEDETANRKRPAETYSTRLIPTLTSLLTVILLH